MCSGILVRKPVDSVVLGVLYVPKLNNASNFYYAHVMRVNRDWAVRRNMTVTVFRSMNKRFRGEKMTNSTRTIRRNENIDKCAKI